MKNLTSILDLLSRITDTIQSGLYPMIGLILTIGIVNGLQQPFVQEDVRVWGMWALAFVGAYFIGKLRNSTKD